MSEWIYRNEYVFELPKDIIGFVYLIINLSNNKKYIGKKLAKFKKTRPPLKGKKHKRRSLVSSDWRSYYGSSNALNEDIDTLGKDTFRREILHYCYNRSTLSYLEAKEQFDRNVLFDRSYYNGIINVRVGGSRALAQELSEKFDF